MRRLFLALATTLPAIAGAQVTLVQTNSPGYYNNSIGTSLNLSNTGIDGCAEPFPLSDDCSASYPSAPNLSAASAALGNWLTDPLNLNANWTSPPSIPNSWTAGNEVAVIYQFNTLGATNVQARFGVDNGIFVWLNGNYILGRRDPGGVSLGEYTLALGDLPAGTHFLQLLLEDHGSASGYAVEIRADQFTPGPPPTTVPEPSTWSMLGLGLGAVTFAARRRHRSA
ncbi:PEP-CTERM sorting domain-containing protein [Roseisolibacter sp. H3M3-2]|uniref:PEP-CTERM sorting domain-containing protein n=1 Tax=Roseisolibacter sp. H3M3-2 TaxID=3031323 RepID=UPI0023DB4830|nr:PEP-CTERM sorting domain-containing protein [Roseisolibacter sp. H3M3-2]MDF1503416.1 PEP-CTERM sorting domain-containing protein [Roseisolibacter sp. H3M3-2]